MRRVLPLAVLLLLVAAPLAQAQETPRLEQIIPDHSFVVLSLDDVNSMRAQCRRTALAKLWREPEVQQYLAPALKLFEKELAKAERQLGHPIAGLLDYFQGQAALAVVEFDPMTMGMVPDIVVLVDLGGKKAEFEAMHAAALAKWVANINVQDHEHKGVKYQTLTPDMGVEIAVGYLGNALILTTLPQRMTAVIDATQGGLKNPLAGSESYSVVQKRIEGDSSFLRVWVNLQSILDTFGDMMDPETARIMDEMGVNGIQGMGYSARFIAEGVRDTFYVHVPGEKKGLVKLAYTTQGDATKLFSRVPKNAFYASAFGLDLDKLGEIILDMIGNIQPWMLDQVMGGIAQAEDFLGLSIRDDLLKAFGEEHAIYVALPEDGGLVPDLVFMSKLREPDRFMEAMGQVAQKAMMFVEDDPRLTVDLREMKFMGKTIYYIYVMHEYGDPFPVTPACVLDGDVMACALLPQTIKNWIARGAGAPSILERPDFVRARRGLPEGLTSLEYVDFQSAVRLLYGTLAPIAQAVGKDSDCPMDHALLPRTETIAKHLFGGIWGMKAESDGVAMYAYSPTGVMPLFMLAFAGAATFMMAGAEAPPPFEMEPEVREAPAQPKVTDRPPTPARLERMVKGRLEEIYIALLFHYAQTDAYAADLGALVRGKALDSADTLLLPGDLSPGMSGGVKSSFKYVGPGVGNLLEGAETAVWVYTRPGLDKGGLWVLFASGDVRMVPLAEFDKLLAATKERLAK